MGSSIKFIGVTITDYDYDGYERYKEALDFTAEKLDICQKKKKKKKKKKTVRSCVGFLDGKGCFCFSTNINYSSL